MGRRRRDWIDDLLERWGRQRQALFGERDPNKAWPHKHQWLGAPDCTLADVKDFRDAAGASGAIRQHFPEVYLGLEFLANQAFQQMSRDLRMVLDAHYRLKGKIPAKIEAIAAESNKRPMSHETYTDRLREGRARVETWIQAEKFFRESAD